ncbi:phage gpG-like protein [Paucibacter oligotrophus]|uniref:Phage gpG-like protein n=1 Tax=Roseateles oligotrophus TaxID=1769250 RepID=A0A840LI99_9BURK|nr:phage virion morphogenesis protein [Roseateles oligotrophus]MBB4844987.1 phage gpG-like protein [Roseateles oligotrophus]
MLTVTVDSAPVAEVLSKLLGRLDDLTPAMASIGQELESRVSGRFETETDPLGHPWAPWAESTKESYPKDGNHRILDRYGDMLRSLNSRPDKTSVRVGFGAVSSKKGKDAYAVYHEWSTEHMPRRGLLMADPDAGTLAPDDEQAVLDILGTFLVPASI